MSPLPLPECAHTPTPPNPHLLPAVPPTPLPPGPAGFRLPLLSCGLNTGHLPMLWPAHPREAPSTSGPCGLPAGGESGQQSGPGEGLARILRVQTNPSSCQLGHPALLSWQRSGVLTGSPSNYSFHRSRGGGSAGRCELLPRNKPASSTCSPSRWAPSGLHMSRSLYSSEKPGPRY